MSRSLILAVLVATLAVTTTLSAGRDAHALAPWMLDTMPSNSAGGSQAGLHFDDGTLAARDFTPGSGTAWLRGMLYSKGDFSRTTSGTCTGKTETAAHGRGFRSASMARRGMTITTWTLTSFT